MGRTQCEKRENIELDKKTEETSYKISCYSARMQSFGGVKIQKALGSTCQFYSTEEAGKRLQLIQVI